MDDADPQLVALCREIVRLSLGAREQQELVREQNRRISRLETLLIERIGDPQPRPLDIPRGPDPVRLAAVESLRASFEDRVEAPEPGPQRPR